MAITSETPVRNIVIEAPAAIPLLEHFGIDYCCGSKHTLAEACFKRDQSIDLVLEELEHQGQDITAQETKWQTAPLRELIDHIVQKHHAFAREHLSLICELPRRLSVVMEMRILRFTA